MSLLFMLNMALSLGTSSSAYAGRATKRSFSKIPDAVVRYIFEFCAFDDLARLLSVDKRSHEQIGNLVKNKKLFLMNLPYAKYTQWGLWHRSPITVRLSNRFPFRHLDKLEVRMHHTLDSTPPTFMIVDVILQPNGATYELRLTDVVGVITVCTTHYDAL